MSAFGFYRRCSACERDWKPAQVNEDGSCPRCDGPTVQAQVPSSRVPDTIPEKWPVPEPHGYQGPPLSC